MKKLITAFFILTGFLTVSAQTYSEDSLELAQTIDWLEKKLTYHYFNGDDNEWWINRFGHDPKTKKNTIRNISSENVGALSERSHLQRIFYFSDMNPYTISIAANDENAGRLVKGKTIKVETYKNEKLISQIKNGLSPSNQSFHFFAIPHYYEDSLANYTTMIKSKLERAILLSTRMYPRASFQDNLDQLQSVIQDRFNAKDGSYIEFTQLFSDVIELSQFSRDGELIRKGFLKALPAENLCLWIDLRPSSPARMLKLKFQNGNSLDLKSTEFGLSMYYKNEVKVIDDGIEKVFIRDDTYVKTYSFR